MESNLNDKCLAINQVTSYQEWFISALKSTKVSDNGDVDEKSLLQNCITCHNEVKRLLEKNEKEWIAEYDKFRLNSTIILFLSCPSVKSVSKINLSKDLLSLIKSLPSISEANAFSTLLGLKNYRYLRGMLPWLPMPTLFNLVSSFFTKTKIFTPISLAISYELLIGLSNSVMYYEGDSIDCEMINAFDTFLEFFNSKEHKFDTEQNIRLEAYFFLYLFKSLFVYIKLLSTQTSEDLATSSIGLQLKNLYIESPKVYPQNLEEIIDDFIKKLIAVLSQIFPLVTSNIWIDWHSIRLPPLDLPESQSHRSISKTDNDDIQVQKSVQIEIAQTAFKIKNYLLNKEPSRKILNIQEFDEFLDFLKVIAIDPDHDPDFDFSNEELLEFINKTEEKRKKYVNILFMRDNIFDSSECLISAKTYGFLMKKECIVFLLLKAIHTLKSNMSIVGEWVQIILDVAKKVPTEDLSTVIRKELSNGKDDILKTKDFNQDITYVFNQLSEHQDSEYNGLFVWLCLQDGKEVIKRFVEYVISLNGLASIAASALKTVYFVCQAEDDEGSSILTSCLVNCWDENMLEKERKEFLLLVLKLLEKKNMENTKECESKSQIEELEILPIRIFEVVDYFIIPKLKCEGEEIGQCIPVVVEILKVIIDLYPDTIVDASPKFTSIIVSLIFLYNNCSYLRNPDYSATLNLRGSIQYIIIKMIKHVNEHGEDFNKVAAILQHFLSNKVLHSRCLLLLSPLIELHLPESLSVPDDIFRHIFLGSAGSLFLEQIPKNLPAATRMQWVWSLSILLPHCNYDEWRNAMKLTNVYLNQSVGSSTMVIHTLKLFQEVLFLICTTTSINSHEFEDTEVSLGSKDCLLSVDCCFKIFSLVATNFISERNKAESCELQFYGLINIFIWWCKSFKGFTCNPELPSIFLSSLYNLMQDLFNSESLIVTETSDLVNNENKDFFRKNDDIQIKNFVDGETQNDNISSECKLQSDCDNNCSSSNSLIAKAELINKMRFEEKIRQIVHTLIVYVPANSVGATIAGKLKLLYERQTICVSSFLEK